MADLLQRGAAWLAGQMKSHASQTVVYQRGTLSVSLAATIGRTEFEVLTETGGAVRVVTRDYLLDAADLVLGGAVVTPKAGDRIAETVGDEQHVYEATMVGAEPPWRWSDPHRQRLRIHTQRVQVTRG